MGFFGVIRKFMFVFAAEMALFGRSKVNALNVLGAVAENTVLPIM